MKFPNTFKGIKKIWIAEMLMLLAAVLSIVLVFVIAGNSVVIDDAVVVNTEAVKTPTAIIGIGAAVIILVAFLLNLIGIINCRKDDKNFSTP